MQNRARLSLLGRTPGREDCETEKDRGSSSPHAMRLRITCFAQGDSCLAG